MLSIFKRVLFLILFTYSSIVYPAKGNYSELLKDPQVVAGVMVATTIAGIAGYTIWHKYKQKGQFTALHYAAARNCIQLAQDVIAEAPKNLINAQDSYGATALIIAICERHNEIVKLLLANDADTTIRNKQGFAAIHAAVASENYDALQMLIDQGVDIETPTPEGLSPLAIAVLLEKSGIVKFLLERGALPYGPKGDFRPLHVAIRKGNKQIASILVNHPIDLEATDSRWFTALHEAAKVGDSEIIEMLLNKGALINAQAEYNHTPLSLATYAGHTKAVKLLIKRGADVHIRITRGFTLIHLIAALENIRPEHVEILILLIQAGCNYKDSANDWGLTPCQIAQHSKIKAILHNPEQYINNYKIAV